MRRLFFILRVDGGWGPTFWFFKSLDINMVYSLGIYVCIYSGRSLVVQIASARATGPDLESFCSFFTLSVNISGGN